MKKRILTLFCVLVLLVTLAIPAFAATFTLTISSGNFPISSSEYDSALVSFAVYGFDHGIFYLPDVQKIRITSLSAASGSGSLSLKGSSGNVIAQNSNGTLQVGQVYDNVYQLYCAGGAQYETYSVSIGFDFVYPDPVVSPALSNPVSAGSYSVSGLYSSSVGSEMYPNPSWGSSVFAFSSVTAPTGTTVKAHTSSGNVTVGTLANGFSFRSSDYPTADYFFVDNQTTTPASYTVSVSAINFGVSPAFTNPIQPGEYDVTDLIGTQNTNRMYITRDDPKTFTFSDVTANASTVVSYAIASEGGTISYHNIGTLTEGFTFSSADYPVASFFTVRNTGSSLASYTVTVENDSFEKSQGIAKSIWETCLEMGTSMINWLKTPSNFIALIPLAMFVLVGAVLMIRKLIKGV